MASGFDSMIKNVLGIDPKELREKLKAALPMLQNMASEVQKTLLHFDARMNTLERGQKEILEFLRASKPETVTIDAKAIEDISHVGHEGKPNGTGKRAASADAG